MAKVSIIGGAGFVESIYANNLSLKDGILLGNGEKNYSDWRVGFFGDKPVPAAFVEAAGFRNY